MSEGMYPDAPPTAPGGMSRKALAAELHTVHGWTKAQVQSEFGHMRTWAKMIDTVCQERLNREAEQRPEVVEGKSRGEIEEMMTDVGIEVTDNDDDIDALLADLEQASAEAETLIEEHKPVPETAPLFIGLPGVKDYIFAGHRGTGPSGAERWMHCTASLGATRAFLETLSHNQQVAFAEANLAARQGTTAHAVAETQARVLMGEVSPEEAEQNLIELAIMPATEGEAYTDEMEEYVSEYVDYVRQFVDAGREVRIEEKVTATVELLTVTNGEPDLYDLVGSADLIVLPDPDEPTLVVADLKYGENIAVDVEHNPQVRIYALGALALVVEAFDGLPDWLTDVEYAIVQPRLGGIKVWSEPVDDLLAWQDEVLSKALTEALAGAKGGAAFNPSDTACQWCPVRGSCPALIEHRVDAAADLFDAVVEAEFADGPGAFPETATMDSDRLAALYTQITGLTKLAGEMKEELQRRLHRGLEVPGYHLVNYQPPRKWKPEAVDQLDPNLHHDEGGLLTTAQREALWLTDPVLVTPTAAEKLLGDDYGVIEALVDKPEKRPVVAPVTDRRSKWEGRPPEAMFEDEGE